MTDLLKAAEICTHVAESRKRWGRHAGFGEYTPETVLDALLAIHEAGLFELEGEKDARIASNRAKGAAEARAKKYKDQLDEKTKELRDALRALESMEKHLDMEMRTNALLQQQAE